MLKIQGPPPGGSVIENFEKTWLTPVEGTCESSQNFREGLFDTTENHRATRMSPNHR